MYKIYTAGWQLLPFQPRILCNFGIFHKLVPQNVLGPTRQIMFKFPPITNCVIFFYSVDSVNLNLKFYLEKYKQSHRQSWWGEVGWYPAGL